MTQISANGNQSLSSRCDFSSNCTTSDSSKALTAMHFALYNRSRRGLTPRLLGEDNPTNGRPGLHLSGAEDQATFPNGLSCFIALFHVARFV
jgi:hypothetical protein